MDDPTFTSTFGNAQLPTHEAISRRAQELWEQYGRPSGRDEEIWFEAERQLRSSATAPASMRTSTPSAATPLDDGNVAPASRPTVVPPVTTLPPTAKAGRAGGKKRPGGGAK